MQVHQICSSEYAKIRITMENAKEKIYSILENLLQNLNIEDVTIIVERPHDLVNGDYSSNIALLASKKLNISPMELAQELVDGFGKSEIFEKIEIAAPGFINFYLSKKYLQSQTEKIVLEGKEYGKSKKGKGKRASVEFVSANPTGPLHIGNARGGPLGDTLANVLEKAGYEVTREYLHNNVGGQVERFGETIYFEIHPDQKPEEYVAHYPGEYVKDLAKLVKEQLEGSEQYEELSQEQFIEKAGEIAVEIMLEDILRDCKDMGIVYDKVVKESDLRRQVPQVLEKIHKYLKENEGALWFAPNDEFLKDRETVVKKTDGEYTYFASDIAYHNDKMSQNDLAIDVLGSNHSGHVPRLQAAVKALGYDPDNFKTILYQFVRLKRGDEVVRMGKRFGNIITSKEVLDEVGKDAFRFFLLMPKNSTHMDFDLELAKKQATENPVFYVQYAHSRISSIFSKAQDYNFSNAKYELLTTNEEVDLIRKLIVFPELIEEISDSFAVNSLTTYAMEIATAFHKFYEAEKVITDVKEESEARLALIKATQVVLKNTLDLLGVSAPERM